MNNKSHLLCSGVLACSIVIGFGQKICKDNRDAGLSIGRDPAQPDPGNPIQTYLPQPASMPPPNPSTAVCGSYCGWILYQGPNGAGFDPATATPALTKGLVKVRVGDTQNQG